VEDGIREIREALVNGVTPDPAGDIYHNFRYLAKHGLSQAPGRVRHEQATAFST
jgi:hypothetical protein